MRRLGAGTATVAMLLLVTCADPGAPAEDVGRAALPIQPLLGPAEAGWRLPSPGDFNQDGLEDVIWRDHTTNHFTVSLMRGTRVLEHGPTLPGPPGAHWIVVLAGGDYNLDGMADVLWYDPPTNRFSVWLMRGTEPFERGREIAGPPGDGWICVPALDFNLDGMADLLWYNRLTNRLTVWLMHGTEPFERGPEIPGPPGGTWLPGFGGDFDRDGMADVFWYDSVNDRVAVWLMAGTAVRAAGPPIPGPGDGWILAAAGDFNHDFAADTLWFHPRRKRVTISLMLGTGLLEQGPEIPAPPGEGWIVGNAADCNGDGMSDILWLDAEPLRMRVSLMNGTVPMETGPDIPGPAGG
jgi:FG-GAP-like repeat